MNNAITVWNMPEEGGMESKYRTPTLRLLHKMRVQKRQNSAMWMHLAAPQPNCGGLGSMFDRMRNTDLPESMPHGQWLRAVALRETLRDGLQQLDGMGADLAAAHLAATIDALNQHFHLD
ncbi:hypothetical protein [Novosphingobium terrae]|uniref:hypothetical protein n=1 Tax=Novosphingobium terrae TaxID=2726189 RepID=UPI001981FD10|nr:hypothetical protein [Novosphingobium terrae]